MYDGTNFQLMNSPSGSAVAVSDVQNEAYTYASDSGSANTYAVSLASSPGSYSAGLIVQFLAANANTGTSTLNVNSLGAKTIKKLGTLNLEASDIRAGQIMSVVYDGTNFQMMSMQTSPTYIGSTTITTLGTVGTGTWQGTSVAVAYGGTGAATASGARSNLSAAASGANADITSLSGLTTALSVGQGGTGATTASGARSNLSAAKNGSNSDITSLSGLTTALSVGQGGTGATTAAGALSSLGAAGSGVNQDIVALKSFMTSDTGTANTYAVAPSPAVSSYSVGLMLAFNPLHANTGASTLNVNSLGAKSIKKQGSLALESGDIATGQMVLVVYDGTNFQLINTLQMSPSYAGQSTITTLGTIATGTWNGSVLGTAYGGTGANNSAPALGTILAGTGSVFNELTVGTNGNALVADSTQTLGIKWGIAHKMSTATKTANYTVTSSDIYIRADASSNNVTITLPDASTVGSSSGGSWFEIKRIDNSGHTCTVATTSSQTIDGSTTYSLASQYATLKVMSNGSNWDIV